jgi:hypothetical protein
VNATIERANINIKLPKVKCVYTKNPIHSSEAGIGSGFMDPLKPGGTQPLRYKETRNVARRKTQQYSYTITIDHR